MPININGTPIDQTAKLPNIDGTELVPVGGRGIYHITTEQVRDYILQHFAKDAINLGNVDNTSDLDKPLSTSMVQALSLKLDSTATLVHSVNGKSGDIFLDKVSIGLGNVDNTSDLDKPVSTATLLALDTKVALSTFNTFKSTVNDFNNKIASEIEVLGKKQTNFDKTVQNLFEDNNYLNQLVNNLTNYVNDNFYNYSQTLSSAQLSLVQDFLNSSTDHVLYSITAVENKLKSLESSVNISLEALQQQIAEVSNHSYTIETLVEHYNSETLASLLTLSSSLTDTNNSISTLDETFSSRLKTFSDAVTKENLLIKDLIKEASEAYVQDLADFQQTVNATYDTLLELIKQVGGGNGTGSGSGGGSGTGSGSGGGDYSALSPEEQFYLLNLENMYQEAVRDFDKKLEESMKVFEKQAKDEIKTINDQLEGLSQGLVDVLDVNTGQMDAQTTATRNELRGVIADTKVEINNQLSNTLQTVENITIDVNNKLANIDNIIAESIVETEDRLNANLEALEERLSSVTSESSQLIIKEAVDQANNAVDKALGDIIDANSRLDLAVSNYGKDLEGFQQELTKLQSALELGDTTAINEAIRNLTTSVSEVDGKVLSISEDVLRLQGEVTTTIDNLNTKVDSSVLNDYYTSQQTDEAIASQLLALNSSILIGGANLLLRTKTARDIESTSLEPQVVSLYELVPRSLKDLGEVDDDYVLSFNWKITSGLGLLNTPENSKALLTFQWNSESTAFTPPVTIAINNLTSANENSFAKLLKAPYSWGSSDATHLTVLLTEVPKNVKITLSKFMLERGSRKSKWVPAIEDAIYDLQAEIDLVEHYFLSTHRDSSPAANLSNGAGLLDVNHNVLFAFQSGFNVLIFKDSKVTNYINIPVENLLVDPKMLTFLIKSLDPDETFVIVGTDTLGEFSFKDPKGDLLVLRDLLISCGAPKNYLETWGSFTLPLFIGKPSILEGILYLSKSSLTGFVTKVPLTFINGFPSGIENNNYHSLMSSANASAIFTTNTNVEKINGELVAQADQLLNLSSTVEENKAELTNYYYTKVETDEVISQEVSQYQAKLEVGSRNYLLNSQTGANSKTISSAFDIYNIRGRNVQMSFDINITTAVTSGSTNRIGFSTPFTSNGTQQYLSVWLNNASSVGTYKGRVKASFKMPLDILKTDASPTTFTYNNQTSGGAFTISNVKLEVSDIPTDWTPAPEDIINSTNARFNEIRNYVVTTQRNTYSKASLKKSDNTIVQAFTRGLWLITFNEQGEKISSFSADVYTQASVEPLNTAIKSLTNSTYFLIMGVDALATKPLFETEDTHLLELKNLLLTRGATEDYLNNWTLYQLPIFIGRKDLGTGNGSCYLLTSTIAQAFLQVPLTFVGGVPTTTLNGVQDLVNKATANAIFTTKSDVNKINGEIVAQANQILELNTSVDNTNTKLINDYYTSSQTNKAITGNLTEYKAQLKDQTYTTATNNLFSYTDTPAVVGMKSDEYSYTCTAVKAFDSFCRIATPDILKKDESFVVSFKIKITSTGFENIGLHHGGISFVKCYINNQVITSGYNTSGNSTVLTSPLFLVDTEIDVAIEYVVRDVSLLDTIAFQLNRDSVTQVSGVLSYIQLEKGDSRTAWKPSLRDQAVLNKSSIANAKAIEDTKASVDKVDGKVIAQAEKLLELESEVDGNQAKLVRDYYTKADTDEVIAEEISVLSTNIDNLETTIERDYYTSVKAEEAIAQGIQRYEADTSFRYQSTNLYPNNKDKFMIKGNLLVEVEDSTANSPTVLKLVDDTRIITNDVIKVDPNRLYKLSFRVKRVEGAGGFYLGLVSLNYDKSKFVRYNTSLADAVITTLGSNENYLVSNIKPDLGSWYEATYYIKGISVGSTSGSGTIESPRTLPKGTVYITPFIMANYNTTGTTYLDYAILEEAEYAAGIDANAKAITTTSAEVTRINGQVVAQAQQLTSLDSKTNSSASFPLGNSADTTKKNQWLTVVLDKPLSAASQNVLPDFSKLGAYPERSLSYQQDGSTFGTYRNAYIYYRTIVSVAADKTISFTDFKGDDAHAIYVNGTLVYSRLTYSSTTIPVTFNLSSGTNIVDVVVYDGSGSGGFLATPNLSTLVDSMYAPSNVRLDVQTQATLINDRYTKSETNSAIASEITKLDASLTTTVRRLTKGTEYPLDLSALDPNTWYAITYEAEVMSERVYISIQEGLDIVQSPVVPWSTHSTGKITIAAEWSSFSSEWGSRQPQLEISGFSFSFATVSPLLHLGQLTNNSLHFFYLRGGAKYKFFGSNVNSKGLVRLTSNYSKNSQTLSWSRKDYANMTTPVSTTSTVQATATNLQVVTAAVEKVDGRITSEADRITKLDTTVGKNYSTLIDNYYSKTDLDNSTTGRFAQFKSTLVVGGRNTLTNSSLAEDTTGWVIYKTPTITFVNSTTPFGQSRVAKITTEALSTGAGIYQRMVRTDNSSGDWFTASVWLKGEVGGEVVRFLHESHTDYSDSVNITLTDKWKCYSITARRSNNTGSITLYSYLAQTFYAARIQYERGTLASEWKETPEDTDSKIAAAVTATDTLRTTVTEVDKKAIAASDAVSVIQGTVRDVTKNVETNTSNIANRYTKNEVDSAISGSINSFTSQLKSVKEASILATTGSTSTAYTNKANSGGFTLVDEPTATLGKAIQFTSNDTNFFPSQLSIVSFDAAKLYKVTARARRVSGTDGYYLGVQALDETLAKHVRSSNDITYGEKSLSACHYFVNNAKPALGVWQEYTYYIQGRAEGASTGSGTLSDPRKLANLSRYMRPVIWANYGATTANVQEIDYIKIEDITDGSRLDLVAEAVGGLSTRVDNHDGDLRAQAKDVTNLTSSLENLNIGGANLLKTTNWQSVNEINGYNKDNGLIWGTTLLSSVLPFTRPGGQTLGFRINSKAGSGALGFMTPNLDGKRASVIAGRTYTLSFVGQGTFSSLNYCYLLYPGDTANFQTKNIPFGSGGNTRRSVTFVAPTSSDDARVLIAANRTWLATDWFSVAEVKLEEGNYATDWQPNTTYEANALATASSLLEATVSQQGKDILASSKQVTDLNASLPYQGSDSNMVFNANFIQGVDTPFNTGTLEDFNDGTSISRCIRIPVNASTNHYPMPKISRQFGIENLVTRIKVSPGETYLYEVEVYTTVARNIRLTSDTRNASDTNLRTVTLSGYQGSATNITVPANTWTKLSGTLLIASDIDRINMVLRLNTVSAASDVYCRYIKICKLNERDLTSAQAFTSLTAEVERVDGNTKSQSTQLTVLENQLSGGDVNLVPDPFYENITKWRGSLKDQSQQVPKTYDSSVTTTENYILIKTLTNLSSTANAFLGDLYTIPFRVKEGNTYTISGKEKNNVTGGKGIIQVYLRFFDKDNSQLSQHIALTKTVISGNISTYSEEFVAPTGAFYGDVRFRLQYDAAGLFHTTTLLFYETKVSIIGEGTAKAVSKLTSSVDTINGELKAQASSVTELQSSLKNVNKDDDNLLDYSKLIPGFYGTNGSITTNTTNIDVYDETYYAITGGTVLRGTKVDASTEPSGGTCRLVWYDKDKTFLSVSTLLTKAEAAGLSRNLTAPSTAAYYRYCLLNNRDRVKLEVGNKYTGWSTSNESGFNTARIKVLATTVNGIRSQYMVKMETNGIIGGFGLMQNKDEFNNVVTSFGVNADSFYIGAPSGNKKPFIVTTTKTTIDGKEYPAGTWINSAIIANATIGTAQIADAAITTAKIDNLAVTNALIANAAITNAKIANLTIESGKIKDAAITSAKIGNAQINDAHIANLNASKITAGTIDAARIRIGSSSSYDNGYDPAANLQVAKDYTDIDSYSNMKTFNNVTGYSTRTSSFTNTLVIKTPLSLKGYMTKLMLSGYQYAASEETSYSIEIAFYAYNTSTPFNNFRVKSTGIALKDVSLALDSNGQVVILVNKVSAWRYPIITLDKAIIGYTTPPDSFKDGWSLNFETDVTAYTVSSANITIDQAETVQGSEAKVTEVKAQLSEIAADNILTPVEKKQVKTIWDSINVGNTNLLAQATKAGVSSSAYTTAYNTLNTYVTSLLSNMNTNSTIVRNTFNTNFSNVYTQIAALEKLINDAAFVGTEKVNSITSVVSNTTVIEGGKIRTGTINADKLNVTSLSAISANLGTLTTLRNASKPLGARMVLSGSLIEVYDDNNRLRVRLGLW